MIEDGVVVAVPITGVIVYRSGAVVTRAGPLSPSGEEPPGEPFAVRVFDLPLCIDDSSVVARVEGAGAPVVTDVAVALAVTDVEIPLRPEQAAVDAARAAERQAQDNISMLQGRTRALEAMTMPERPEGKEGEPPPPIPAVGRMAFFDFRQSQLDAAAEQTEAARETLRLAINERKAVEDQLRRATTARTPRAHELRKAAHLTLMPGPSSAAQGPWRLVLEYRVPGARWTPAYTLHFDAQLEQVSLDLRASVVQRTGEDWTGVALTVSTARPMSWTGLPELASWRIGRRQPTASRTGWRPAPDGADALYGDYDRAAASLPGLAAPAPPPPAAELFDEEVTSEFMVGGLAEAEPQERARPKRARKTKASAGPPPAPGAMSSAMPAPMPAAAPPRTRSAKASFLSSVAHSGAMSDLAGGGPPAAEAAGLAQPQASGSPPPRALTAADDMLDFGRLRLSGPDSPRRGQLRPLGMLQRYRERLTITQIELTREVLGVVEAATQRASLSDRALPPGHSWPAPVADFEHAWHASHAVDVPADGGWHTLSLLRAETPARRSFVVVPRQAPEVFRVAAFDNPLAAPLPEGPADVFVGGALLLTTPLRTTDQGATVTLGLGVEEGIKVARNTRFDERTSGLLGGTLALQHVIEIAVTNNLAASAQLEVRERVPVVREGDDEVELSSVSADPPWTKWTQPRQPVRGAHHWQVDVPAGSKTTLTARYTVELSAKKELAGGNRREGA